jgi:hypothetical protein
MTIYDYYDHYTHIIAPFQDILYGFPTALMAFNLWVFFGKMLPGRQLVKHGKAIINQP